MEMMNSIIIVMGTVALFIMLAVLIFHFTGRLIIWLGATKLFFEFMRSRKRFKRYLKCRPAINRLVKDINRSRRFRDWQKCDHWFHDWEKCDYCGQKILPADVPDRFIEIAEPLGWYGSDSDPSIQDD
jgi:hypothetical protein